jgi:hypothetical protein
VTDPDQPRTDPLVDRVNDLTTTFFDVAGVLLVSAAAAYGAWSLWGLGWAMLTAGVSLLACSVLAQTLNRQRTPKPQTDDPVVLPGPSDPGNVHFAGGR